MASVAFTVVCGRLPGKTEKKNGCFVVAVVVVVVVVDFVCSAAQQLMAVSSSRADRLINNEGRTRKRMR